MSRELSAEWDDLQQRASAQQVSRNSVGLARRSLKVRDKTVAPAAGALAHSDKENKENRPRHGQPSLIRQPPLEGGGQQPQQHEDPRANGGMQLPLPPQHQPTQDQEQSQSALRNTLSGIGRWWKARSSADEATLHAAAEPAVTACEQPWNERWRSDCQFHMPHPHSVTIAHGLQQVAKARSRTLPEIGYNPPNEEQVDRLQSRVRVLVVEKKERQECHRQEVKSLKEVIVACAFEVWFQRRLPVSLGSLGLWSMKVIGNACCVSCRRQ